MTTQLRIVLRNCGKINPENICDYIVNDGYKALAKVFEMSPSEVVKEMKDSGLRGRGGGGFLTGKKWEIASLQKADKKFVICNADEGDPGAFMDRSVLEGDPHSVLEAMIIAGYAIGAQNGYVYVRAEYPLAIERLNKAINDAREMGLLGKNIFNKNFDFDIEIKIGAGAFVCGEETSLIHSVEGRRGEPTTKPPFPAIAGLWGYPTIVNNVETLANIPVIFLKGAKWFSNIGTQNSKGTKVFALAGKIRNTGLVEVPMGTTLRDVVYNLGGGIINDKAVKAIQTGGPSGGCIPEKFLDTPIDYENLWKLGSMMGSGGMIVLDETSCIVDTAKFYMQFTVDESCGKCTPCRIGNKRLLEMMEKICNGKAKEKDLDELEYLSKIVKDTSLCGLGQSSPNPILSTLNHFRDEYIEHVRDKKCRTMVCSNLISYFINEKCIGCRACAVNCPVNVIAGNKKERHKIDQSGCIKCGKCFTVCKFNAVEKVSGKV